MQWKTTFQVAATYVGAVMGAGFASGQEIQQFFTRFGRWGLVGIVVSALLFLSLGGACWTYRSAGKSHRIQNFSITYLVVRGAMGRWPCECPFVRGNASDDHRQWSALL